MKSKLWKMTLLSFVLVLSACSFFPKSVSYEATPQQAIEKGLTTEGIKEEFILSIEEFKGKTLVFFQKDEGLGLASISETPKGYRWFRSNPLLAFDKKYEYYRSGFNHQTEDGIIIKVLAGVVNDPSVEKIILIPKDDQQEEMEIWNRNQSPSAFFYYLLENNAVIPELVPIIN